MHFWGIQINSSPFSKVTDIKLVKGGINLDLNSIMSSQLSELQQTVQMSVLKNAMNMETVAAIGLLEDIPQVSAPHPYKGSVVDIQA